MIWNNIFICAALIAWGFIGGLAIGYIASLIQVTRVLKSIIKDKI